MSVSDDLNEIDRILEKPATETGPVTRIVEDRMRRYAAGERVPELEGKPIFTYGDRQIDLARAAGFRMHSSAGAMLANLRAHVMLKMIRQAHEAELAEPGTPPSSGIVGTPEW